LQVDRNLNVSGNITIGGTSATIFSQTLNIYDPDIILGFRTDEFGNDVSTDNTANHGGVSIASTEGNPLVQLFIAGIETNLATYKKIMWFKAGTFSGLGTDAWLSNYAVGIGSTQFPTGTRLAVGNVQFNQSDLAVVRNINASGVITATSGFSGNASSATYATSSGVSTSVIGGIGSITQLQVTGISTFTNGPVIIGSATSTGTASQPLQVTGGAYVSGSVGIATTNPGSYKLQVNGNIALAASNQYFYTNNIGKLDQYSPLQTYVAYNNVDPTITWYGGTGSNLTYNTSSLALYPGTTNGLDLGLSSNLWRYFYTTNAFIGSGTSTGTASQPLQVTGGAYVSGSVGIATTNPTSTLHVVGNARFTGIVTASSFSGNASSATYATTAGIATYATSAGIATYATTAGISTSVIGGIGSITQLRVTGISTFTNGPVLIGSATSTGTASQPLQVTGGAYVSGNVGIGTTAPSFKVDIAGDARVTSTNKMRFGGTGGTTNFYIQYNSTENSLDFVAG
jgi:hypothetical protein